MVESGYRIASEIHGTQKVSDTTHTSDERIAQQTHFNIPGAFAAGPPQSPKRVVLATLQLHGLRYPVVEP